MLFLRYVLGKSTLSVGMSNTLEAPGSPVVKVRSPDWVVIDSDTILYQLHLSQYYNSYYTRRHGHLSPTI